MSKPQFHINNPFGTTIGVIFGVMAGVACGFFMARIAFDAASQTDMKVNALPPIVFSTDWIYVGGFVFALCFVDVIFVWDVFFLKRIRVVETIRISGQSG
ncbi:MAG: hypothetical protein Ct9H300mP19_18070 [Dehalococcoidia bacterium]|nr:MAG: hypothetical protein Ct9H300mP19_18070 [Dehalococcoidia bacterium]